MVSSRERERVKAWVRYAEACRRLPWAYLGKGRKPFSPKTQKNDNDNAVRKIINTCNPYRLCYHYHYFYYYRNYFNYMLVEAKNTNCVSRERRMQ